MYDHVSPEDVHLNSGPSVSTIKSFPISNQAHKKNQPDVCRKQNETKKKRWHLSYYILMVTEDYQITSPKTEKKNLYMLGT